MTTNERDTERLIQDYIGYCYQLLVQTDSQTALRTNQKLDTERLIHTYVNGEMHQQGRVLSEPSNGFFLVQTSEWAGDRHQQYLVRPGDMLRWFFYDRARNYIAPRDNGFEYVARGTRERVIAELESPEFFRAYFPEGWEKFKALKMQNMKLEQQ